MPVAKDSEAGREVVPAEAVEVFDPATRPASMLKRDAVKLTGRIKKGMDDVEARREAVLALIDEAYRGKAWAAMGYASWQQYTMTEFQMSRQRAYQLVNWAELNRELEAEGRPVAVTEREARRTRKARVTKKSTEALPPAAPTECLPVVDALTSGNARKDEPSTTTEGKVKKPEPSVDTPPPPVPPKTTTAAKSREEQVHDFIDQFLESEPEVVAALDAGNLALAVRRAEGMEDWADRYRKAVLGLESKGRPSKTSRSAASRRTATAAERSSPVTATAAEPCRHKDAAGKETSRHVGWGVVCNQCGSKIR